jgi:hypothetical protein
MQYVLQGGKKPNKLDLSKGIVISQLKKILLNMAGGLEMDE